MNGMISAAYRKFRIQFFVALFTLGLVAYFPFFVGQFALLSFAIYIALSSLFIWIARKYNLATIYLLSAHTVSFLLAYSLFGTALYSIVTMTHFGY